MCCVVLIHSPAGHLGCSRLWATVNSAAMNMGSQIAHRDPAFNSLGYVPSSGMARPHVDSTSNILRIHQTAITFSFKGFSVQNNPPQGHNIVFPRLPNWALTDCLTVLSPSPPPPSPPYPHLLLSRLGETPTRRQGTLPGL